MRLPPISSHSLTNHRMGSGPVRFVVCEEPKAATGGGVGGNLEQDEPQGRAGQDKRRMKQT